MADGANAPSIEEVGAYQRLSDQACLFGTGDTGKEAVSGIRTANAARLPLTIESEGVGRDFLAPESLLEAVL